LDGSGQRFPVCMNRQEFDAHRRHSRRGPTDGFLNIKKLEIKEHSLTLRDQTVDHLRPGGSVEFESDLHKDDLILHAIEKPVRFVA
jgi:hypothetical protein